MKFIVSSHSFYPDHSGIALYSTGFARYARKMGHDVRVVAGFSFYPLWKKRKEDEYRLFGKENYDGIKIYRGYHYVPSNPTGFKRIIQELTFLFFAFFNFIRAGKCDAIVVFTTPVSLGVLGWLFSKIYSAQLIINVQDFQVEAADSLGLLGKLPVVPVLKAVEKFSYRRATMVTSISESMVELIVEKGIDPSQTYLWPNWIDVRKESTLGEPNSFRRKFNIPENKIIIGYAGNVGAKQGLSVLIDLARTYAHHPELLFLIIGEGADLANLKKYHGETNTPNLTFLPFLNPAGYKEFLADADVIFISQKKIPKDIYFPSKLLGLMAASKLIFLAADKASELYKVISKNKLGLAAELEDFASLKQCVDLILNKDKTLDTLKSNAWQFVQQFDEEVVLDRVLTKINRTQK